MLFYKQAFTDLLLMIIVNCEGGYFGTLILFCKHTNKMKDIALIKFPVWGYLGTSFIHWNNEDKSGSF